MTDKERRIALSPVRVAASTVTLLRELSEALKLSQGATLDRAVQALAVAESFGAQHLKLREAESDVKVYRDGLGRVVGIVHGKPLDATATDRDSRQEQAK